MYRSQGLQNVLLIQIDICEIGNLLMHLYLMKKEHIENMV